MENGQNVFSEPPGVGHTKGTDSSGGSSLRSNPDTRRSHLYPIECSDVTHIHTAEIYRVGADRVMVWATCCFGALGDWACVICLCSLYQFLGKDAVVSTQAGRNHLGRKSQALGRKVRCPLGPWQKSKA